MKNVLGTSAILSSLIFRVLGGTTPFGHLWFFEGCNNRELPFTDNLLIFQAGHVGISLNSDYECENGQQNIVRDRIYGFSPAGQGEFPVAGQVKDDTEIFKVDQFPCMPNKPMSLKKSSIVPVHSNQDLVDRLCQQLNSNKHDLNLKYSWPVFKPKEFYDPKSNVYNCMTWPKTIGVQLQGNMVTGIVSAVTDQFNFEEAEAIVQSLDPSVKFHPPPPPLTFIALSSNDLERFNFKNGPLHSFTTIRN